MYKIIYYLICENVNNTCNLALKFIINYDLSNFNLLHLLYKEMAKIMIPANKVKTRQINQETLIHVYDPKSFQFM